MDDKGVTALPGPVRRARMADWIAQHEFVRVADLSDEFGISEVTVRSDLDRLGERIHRVRGGAVSRLAVAIEPSLEESLQSGSDEKAAIGVAAADMVRSGHSILLDVGSTTTAVARALVARTDLTQVTVVTNSLSVALELEAGYPRVQVVVTGGTLRPRQHSLVDPLGSVLLDQIHVNIAFIGCNGASASGGITNVNMPEAEMKRRMLAAADHTVVVATGAKIGQVHFARVAQLDEVHTIITTAADPVELDRLRKAGPAVVVAGEQHNTLPARNQAMREIGLLR